MLVFVKQVVKFLADLQYVSHKWPQ